MIGYILLSIDALVLIYFLAKKIKDQKYVAALGTFVLFFVLGALLVYFALKKDGITEVWNDDWVIGRTYVQDAAAPDRCVLSGPDLIELYHTGEDGNITKKILNVTQYDAAATYGKPCVIEYLPTRVKQIIRRESEMKFFAPFWRTQEDKVLFETPSENTDDSPYYQLYLSQSQYHNWTGR